MKAVRITLSVVAAVLAAMFLYMAMTVPAFAATAPAVLGIAAVVLAWLLWPKRKNKKEAAA